MRRTSIGSDDDDMNRLTLASSQIQNFNINQSVKKDDGAKSKISGDTNNNEDKTKPSADFFDQKEWQGCRKRKERQDSTSSMTQDRKLVRSNSEEILVQSQEIIRRVSSHEDFKKPLPLQSHNITKNHTVSEELKKITIDVDTENIPDSQDTLESSSKVEIAKCQKASNHKSSTDFLNDYQFEPENDHEDRRNKERFINLKGRSAGRKSPGSKKLSKKLLKREHHHHHHNDAHFRTLPSIEKHSESDNSKTFDASDDAISLSTDYDKPWYNSLTEYTPVVCQRFADSTFDHSNNLHERHSKISHHYEKFTHTDLNKNSFKNFLNAENTKTRELMQRKYPVDALLQSPDERIKQINKRLVSLKKRINGYEEHFEKNYGYRPSHADKANDKSVKSYFAEINRLRKEKSQIKQDPLAGTEYKYKNDGVIREKRIEKLKDTMLEIEKVSS